jgi:dihydroorotate dehydrogenase/NAD-dependent dihydropyrimidine dehydrogenase PreA subunit
VKGGGGVAKLTTTFAGLRFPNPIVCGAGAVPDGPDGLLAAAAGGAGGLVTRTILAQPFAAPPEPSVVTYGRDGLLTCQRGSQRPAADWTFPAVGVPVIADLAAGPDEVGALGAQLVAQGAKALEFATNFLPWPMAVEALQALRKAVAVPVIAKMTLWHGEDIADRAAAVEPYVDGFTCMGGFGPVLDIDIEAKGAPRLGDPWGYGWLSGAPVHPIAVRTVFEVAGRVRKPVMASGGAMTPRDVVEFLEAGATLVQVATAAFLKGPAIFGTLAAGLNAWLDEHDYSDVAAIRGQYLRKFGHGQRVVLAFEEAPVLEPDKCSGCGVCGLVCWYDAITAKLRELPVIDADRCFECGLCVSSCPEGALSFRPRSEATLLRGR